jgi:hypothetical protein
MGRTCSVLGRAQSILDMYGVNSEEDLKQYAITAFACRMIERGVRFI